MSVNHSVNTLLMYLSKCIDKSITPLELSYVNQLPANVNDVNKETILQLKYYILGWYIYNHLDIKN